MVGSFCLWQTHNSMVDANSADWLGCQAMRYLRLISEFCIPVALLTISIVVTREATASCGDWLADSASNAPSASSNITHSQPSAPPCTHCQDTPGQPLPTAPPTTTTQNEQWCILGVTEPSSQKSSWNVIGDNSLPKLAEYYWRLERPPQFSSSSADCS